jgi:hypothetical protein
MTTYEIYGQDTVSIIIGICLFSLGFIKTASIYKRIVELGFLVYLSYTYAYFSFGLLTSKLYILYLIILSLSFYILLGNIIEMYKNDKTIEGNRYNNIAVSIYVFIVVGIVTVIDVKELMKMTLVNSIQMNPQIVFCVLDLSLLFPAMAISAYLNIKRRLVGIILLGIFLIKTILLMPALILSDLLHNKNLVSFVDINFDITALIILISAIVFYSIHINRIKRAQLVV